MNAKISDVKSNSPLLSPSLTINENSIELSGPLLKWTDYLKGYRKRWFVLTNGLLSYYRYDLAF